MPPVSAMVRLTACSRPRALAGTTSKVDVANEPRDKPLAMTRNEMSTASWKKFWANGISKKARAGMPVLGTVAHFLPILSMMKPAGKIIVKTEKPDMVNKRPTDFGVSQSLELA